jgi:hypothetical protein
MKTGSLTTYAVLPVRTLLGVRDSPRINDARFSFRKFSGQLFLSTIRGVGDSPYQRYAESATPRIVKSWKSIFDYDYLCQFEAKIGKGGFTFSNCIYGTYAESIAKNRKIQLVFCPRNKVCRAASSFYCMKSTNFLELH